MLKRFVMVAVAIVLLASFTIVLGEEKFVLRNGIVFGMSKQEVIAAEAASGIAMEKTGVSTGDAVSDEVDGLESLWNGERRTFAGIDNTLLEYFFMNDKLFQMHYRFPSAYKSTNDKVEADYTSVSAALNQKYGTSEYSTLTGKRITLPTLYNQLITSGYGQHDLWKLEERLWANRDYQIDRYEEWLITQEDGTGVFIHHCLTYDLSDGVNADREHYVFYTLYDKETVEDYLAKSKDAADDL